MYQYHMYNLKLTYLEECTMNELLSVMEEIRDLLIDINCKLDDIKDNSSEMETQLNNIGGSGLYNIQDIYHKIRDVEFAVENI